MASIVIVTPMSSTLVSLYPNIISIKKVVIGTRFINREPFLGVNSLFPIFHKSTPITPEKTLIYNNCHLMVNKFEGEGMCEIFKCCSNSIAQIELTFP